MITMTAIGHCGRFGNQLFQYALLFSVSKKKGYDFYIPNNKECTLSEVFDGIHINGMQNLNQYYPYLGRLPATEGEGNATVFMPEVFQLPDWTNYFGYFQSPKYYKDCENELRAHLKIKDDMLNAAKSFVNEQGGDIGFIHVRRGDYLQNAKRHPPVTVDYLRKATEASKAKKFIVISDDIPWCKENLDFVDVVYSPFSDKHFGYDFALMTQCKSAVISNSTFSWWGAWLGEKKDVVAPSLWFGPSLDIPKKWSDLYCEDWTVL